MAKIHSRKRFFLRKKHSESQQPSPGKQHAVGNQTEMSHQSASRTWEVVVRVRPTLLVAIVGAAILMLPSQVLELYIIDAEAIRLAVFKPPSFENLLSFSEVWTQLSTVATQLRSLFMFGLAGIVAAIVLWLSTIHLLSLPEAIDGQPPRQRRLGLFLAVVIGLSPFLGALAGLNAVRAAIPAIGEANAQVIGGWPSGLSVVPDDYLRATLGFLLVSAILIALILGTFLTTLTTRHLHGLQIGRASCRERV